jgi:hypothetical protein
MKKISLFSLIFATLLFSSSIFAASPSLKTYGSTLHPLAGAAMLHPPTDITIVNGTTGGIYSVVPGSPIYDYINPGYNNHIYNSDPNIWSTYLVLLDGWRNQFFSGTVCRLAIVTVYGYTGNYRVNTDSDLCN